MRGTLSAGILLGAICLMSGSAISSTRMYPIPVAGDSLTPRQFHEAEARLKAAALERWQRAESQLTDGPEIGQENYDVGWYDIHLQIDDSLHALCGKVRLTAAATVDGLSEIAIDLQGTVPIDSITAPSGRLGLTRSGDVVTVLLDRSYDNGEQFEIDVYYHGDALGDRYLSTGLMFGAISGGRIVYNLSEPYFARMWWPCKDRPDDKADSMGIHIEVDSSLYCASNGTLDSIVQSETVGRRVFHYSCRYPIATYLFSVAIAPFVVWEQSFAYNEGRDTMPIVHCVFPNLYNLSLNTYGRTPQMLNVFSQVFGPYPFLEEKYGHASTGYPAGAMEHQTITSMAGTAPYGFDLNIIAHELAHQWWGDLVTCKTWHDVWLNEGWATYAEAVYQLERNGWSVYHEYLDNLAYYGNGFIYRYSTKDFFTIFDAELVYNKAAWVVHMLRARAAGHDREGHSGLRRSRRSGR